MSAGSVAQATVRLIDDDVPQVSVSFELPEYSVGEGQDINVPVQLSGDPERSVTILLVGTVGGGADASDYTVAPQSVTFSTGETAKQFTFTAIQDALDDDGERVTLTLGTLPDGVIAGNTVQTVVSIVDDDMREVSVSFEQATQTVAEGNSVAVKVLLDNDPGRSVEVPLIAVDQNGSSSDDYSGLPASVVFNSGETQVSFTLEATQDSIDDDGESVRLEFGALPESVSVGNIGATTLSIADDDVPSVSVSFGEVDYSAAEGGSVGISVHLSADPERTVAVSIARTNQGGADDGDYSGVPDSVTFNAGETQKSFTVSATQDSADDDGESVKLEFTGLPAGVSVGDVGAATVNLLDDDVPSVSVSFGSSSYNVAEGGSVSISVRLSADPQRTVVIPIARSNLGGADNGDYSGVPDSVTFSSGQTELSIAFAATQDTVDDDGESVQLEFGSLPEAVSVGSNGATTLSIADDDVPSVSVSFGAANYSVPEGGSVGISVHLSADPERTVAVSIARANQGGADDGDYTGVPDSVTFNAGETQKSFSVNATQDSADDDGESVRLELTSLPEGVSVGDVGAATVSLVDDDVPSVSVSFGSSSYNVAEGGTASISVRLSADPQRTVVIPLTRSHQGGADSGDYSGVPDNVTFNSGETKLSFAFAASQDTDNDDDERVKLGFGAFPAGVSAQSTAETTVSIVDDDVPTVSVSFGSSSYSVAEGGSVSVSVRLSADPQRRVVIPISAIEKKGASSSDYSGVPSSVTFRSGETEKSFTFSATQDSIDDDNERVRIEFNALPQSVNAGSVSNTKVDIEDDD